MSEELVDYIIIGSSPLSITEAVYLQKKGSSVLIIDSSDRIGGAWKTVQHKNIPEIEVGCHIWEIENWSTEFLRKFFHLNLVQLKPQPRIVSKRANLPYDWKANLISLKYIANKLRKLRFGELKEFKKSPALRFSFFPNKYWYPKGGGKEICSAIEKVVSEENLQIKNNLCVQELNCKNDVVELTTSKGVFLSKNVVLTSLSDIQKVRLEGELFLIEKTPVRYIHVHLRVENSFKKKFSYERWLNDELIHRISDMTFQVKEELVLGEQLICIGIHESAYDVISEKEIVSKVIEKLKNKNVLSKSTLVKSFAFNVYECQYSNNSNLTELENLSSGKIQVLRSSNFVYSFFNQKEKYQTIID